MKKLTIAILVLAMAAMMVVNCFAADVSTAVSDLDLIYFEDFTDISDIEQDDNYITEPGEEAGTMFIGSAASGYNAFTFSNAPAIAGETKVTFVYSYQLEAAIAAKLIGIAFGIQDAQNFYYLGINNDASNGVKTYHCPMVNGTYKHGETNDQRVYDYQFTDAEFTTKDLTWAEIDKTYTVVIECEIGAEPKYSFYVNGEPCNFFQKDTPNAKGNPFSVNATSFDGPIGFYTNLPGLYLDGIAVYKATGLDHRELIAKINSENGAAGSDTPATEAPTTDAPVTDAPVTDAPVTDAPTTDAPTTDAPETEAPATDAPATDAPATDAPTTDAPKDDKGCGGVIGVGAIVAILGTAVVLKKRD